MQVPGKRLLRLIATFGVFAAVMHFGIRAWFDSDPLAPEVADVVRRVAAVIERVGQVREVKQYGLTIVQASEVSPAARVYRFSVVGDRGHADVVARSQESGSKPDGRQITVKTIE